MRVVLETNVALAGLLWRGKAYELLGFALAGTFRCFATDALIAELDRALGYKRFERRITTLKISIPQLVADYRALVEIVPAASIAPAVIADPDDDHVLACAVAAGADLVVSGDAHLLNLKRAHAIDIVGVNEAVRRIGAIAP